MTLTDAQLSARIAARESELNTKGIYALMAHTDFGGRRVTVKRVNGTFWDAVSALETLYTRYSGELTAAEVLYNHCETVDIVRVRGGKKVGWYDGNGLAY